MQVNYNSGNMPPYHSLIKTVSRNKAFNFSNIKKWPLASKVSNFESIQKTSSILEYPAPLKRMPSHLNSVLPKLTCAHSTPNSFISKTRFLDHNKNQTRALIRVSNVKALYSNSEDSKKPSEFRNGIKGWFFQSSKFSLVKKGFAFHFYNSSTSLPQVNDLYARALHDAKFTESFPPEKVEIVSETSEETESKIESEAESVLSEKALRLNSGACCVPHPAKVDKGGEDAYFINLEENAIGVADGVGGWADMGIDAGLYARELMIQSVDALSEEPKGEINPARVLSTAHSRTKSQGSSTACILVLSNDRLQAANLGDSGFVIIRNGRLLFKSPSQQHDFNFPYQLGSEGCDSPNSAEVFVLPVAAGDVLVAGTDGLFDNVFDNELTSVVMHSIKAGSTPQGTAEKIAALARVRAQDRARVSPFSRAAQEAGWLFIGGKLDDITVVVSYITPG